MSLLRVKGLCTEILTREGPRTIVDDLSFSIEPGEVLAIIGESGSGKSVAMQSIVGLLPSPPGRVAAGSALFEGRELIGLPEHELRKLRGNRIGMIFQEPMSALNPMMAVGDQIAEAIVTHRGVSWSAARAEAVRLLDRVRIANAAERARLHPGALSGGMRQRVVIAAALACKPALVIADEPTTALDAGRDPGSAPGAQSRGRLCGRLHHARHGGGPPDRRPRARDAGRPRGRDRNT
jgi:ABC-type dipeptide/oligopeptide/nickel transport system ATPase component